MRCHCSINFLFILYNCSDGKTKILPRNEVTFPRVSHKVIIESSLPALGMSLCFLNHKIMIVFKKLCSVSLEKFSIKE